MSNYFYESMKNAPQPSPGCGELVFDENEEAELYSEDSFEVRCCGSDGYLCPDCQPEDENAKFWRKMIRSKELNRPEFPEFD